MNLHYFVDHVSGHTSRLDIPGPDQEVAAGSTPPTRTYWQSLQIELNYIIII
jgi:hypothetical protein